MTQEDLRIAFDGRGLVPVVVQDAASGQVLMVAWMNEEALRLTQETGQAHFWSRSRNELWRKGATSGNVMHVRNIQVDCDADTLLLQVDPAGPACHTGQRSCFFRRLGESVEVPPSRGNYEPQTPSRGNYKPGSSDVLHELFATILERRGSPRAGSYTARLLEAGEDESLKKVGEESVEVILAAKAQGNGRLTEEVADLTYHVLVLLASRGLTPADIAAEQRVPICQDTGFAVIFWSSSPIDAVRAWSHGMNGINFSVSSYPALKADAFPVRCLRD